MDHLSGIIGIALGFIAIVTTIVNYALVINKLKWESEQSKSNQKTYQEQVKTEKTTMWARIDKVSLEIESLKSQFAVYTKATDLRLENIDAEIKLSRERYHDLANQVNHFHVEFAKIPEDLKDRLIKLETNMESLKSQMKEINTGGKLMNPEYNISIKGVVCYENKFLLRYNERNEYELVGGRLENKDNNFRERLTIEFFEETGLRIQVNKSLSPFIYIIGDGVTLIFPYICELKSIAPLKPDIDGGKVVWINSDEIKDLNMPDGYKDCCFQNKYIRNSYSNKSSVKNRIFLIIKLLRYLPTHIKSFFNKKNFKVNVCIFQDNEIIKTFFINNIKENIEKYNTLNDYIKQLSELNIEFYGEKDPVIEDDKIIIFYKTIICGE